MEQNYVTATLCIADQNNYIFGLPLSIQYTTFLELLWRLKVVFLVNMREFYH